MPLAKQFMSRVNIESQSVSIPISGEGTPTERLTGDATHKVPPWKTELARPLLLYNTNPALLGRAFDPVMLKPDVAEALGVPVQPMAGSEPHELTLAVQ